MPDISLVNLRKSYGAVEVCRGINLEIRDREFVTLLGSSGCGKTTTLNIVGGLDTADSGDVLLDGVRVNDLEPVERDVAMVFQNYALYPHMTVAQNIGFNLKLRGLAASEIGKKVNSVAAALDLDRLLDRYPSQLSGGQQQRVAIGRAIVREPKVFLFDEPFSNLDAELRIRMRSEVRELHLRHAVTSVFVTHDQEEALSISDKIAVMRNGVVEQFGTPEEIYASPATTYVARFVGHPQVEILPAELTSAGSKTVLRIGEALLDLSDAQIQMLRKHNSDFAIAVRPEFVSVSESGIEAVVREVQPVGPFTILRLSWNGGSITASSRGIHRLEIGANVRATIDTRQLMFFDTSNGRRIDPAI
jgi:ABC-type sugar transport system ATPase subunit